MSFCHSAVKFEGACRLGSGVRGGAGGRDRTYTYVHVCVCAHTHTRRHQDTKIAITKTEEPKMIKRYYADRLADSVLATGTPAHPTWHARQVRMQSSVNSDLTCPYPFSVT